MSAMCGTQFEIIIGTNKELASFVHIIAPRQYQRDGVMELLKYICICMYEFLSTFTYFLYS